MAQEIAEGSGSLAWRVLATLEGGTFAIVTAALLAHTLRTKLRAKHDRCADAQSVLISNDSKVGHLIKKTLVSYGCAAKLLPDELSSGAISETISEASKEVAGTEIVDAVVVIGTKKNCFDLESLSDVISKDVNCNIMKLNSLSRHIRPGGLLVWVSMSEATSGAFSGASRAFDNVLKANLELAAKSCRCRAIWIGREKSDCHDNDDDIATTKSVVEVLLPSVRSSLNKNSLSIKLVEP